MTKKKFKFYENKEKLYIPETKEELRRFISISNLDFKQIDTSRITDMSKLFKDFRFKLDEMGKGGLQDISNWDVSNVKDMSYMFAQSNFNGNINNWNVSKVKNMRWMFYNSNFNKNINNWDVSSVEDMQGMFAFSSFNQDISNWDVSNVKDMEKMFMYSDFNQDISNWDISNVRNMVKMFYDSKFLYFNEILEKWPKNINLDCNIEDMFLNLKIQKEFENRIKKYQKLKYL